jgi:hypothetical protein
MCGMGGEGGKQRARRGGGNKSLGGVGVRGRASPETKYLLCRSQVLVHGRADCCGTYRITVSVISRALTTVHNARRRPDVGSTAQQITRAWQQVQNPKTTDR